MNPFPVGTDANVIIKEPDSPGSVLAALILTSLWLPAALPNINEIIPKEADVRTMV